MSLEEILEICRTTLSQEIKFGFVFGSAAKGRLTDKSDVDLAIWLREAPHSMEAKYALKMTFGEHLSRLLARNVDMVILNDADLIIAMQVIDHGVPFGISDQKAYWKFKSDTMTRYAEFKFKRKVIEDRLENGRVFKK